MQFQRWIRSVLSGFAAVVLLSGCLDYEEVMTIHKDLSGKADITVTLPETISGKFADVHEQLSVKNVESAVAKVQGVRLELYEKKPGVRSDLKIRLAFDSPEAWNALVETHPMASVVMGKFNSRKVNDNWVIERQLGKAAAGTEVNSAAVQDTNVVLYTTKFELPIQATNSKQYNNHGQEVRYREPLQKIINEKMLMSTTVKAPSPWPMIILGTLVFIVVLWWAWKWMKEKSANQARRTR